MAYGDGIKLSVGFDVKSAVPLDNRTIFASEDDLKSFANCNSAVIPIGLVAIVTDTYTQYVWDGKEFKEVLGSISKKLADLTSETKNSIDTINSRLDNIGGQPGSDTLASLQSSIQSVDQRVTELQSTVNGIQTLTWESLQSLCAQHNIKLGEGTIKAVTVDTDNLITMSISSTQST
jgi:hypothetical protein